MVTSSPWLSLLYRGWPALLLLALIPGLVSAGSVQTRLSRNPVGLDESFELVFEVRSETSTEPDFSPLQPDFEILERGQNQSVQIINNQVSRKVEWRLSLLAKRAGDLQIPPIRFDNDQSQPIHIKVVETAAQASVQGTPELFLEVTATPEKPLVQAQILYTQRLLVAETLGEVRVRRFSHPEVEGMEAEIQPLGEVRQYQNRRGGKLYTVLERRFAIFPQQPGPLTLAPLLFEGEVGGRGRSPFNLFNDPLLGRPGEIRRARSQPLKLEVRPIPQGATNQPWLPAESLQLADTWSKDTGPVELGQPLTWTIALLAEGLGAAQLPALASRLQLPEGLKIYPDQPVTKDQAGPNGLAGSRQEKLAILATRAGSYEIPGITLPWWNTKLDRAEVASIAPRRLLVMAGTSVDHSPAPSGMVDLAHQDGAPCAPHETVVVPPQNLGANPWFWVSLMLGGGWIGTLWLWRFRKTQGQRAVQKHQPTPASVAKTLRALQAAYAVRDLQAARGAWLDWGRAIWPDLPPLSLEALAPRVPEPAREALAELARSLYGRNGGDWAAHRPWTALETLTSKRSRLPDSAAPLIAELNP